jgi:tRNA 2-selenouridine synthase
LVYLEETLENRVQNILMDYVKSPLDSALNEASIQSIFEDFKRATKNISKKLGGLRSEEIQKSILQSEEIFLKTKNIEPNLNWIQLLLIYYYDPLYETSLERRQPKILFRGDAKSMLDFFKRL